MPSKIVIKIVCQVEVNSEDKESSNNNSLNLLKKLNSKAHSDRDLLISI